MAWDSSRPVPWQRLTREWLIYAAIMSAVFIFVLNNGNPVGAIAGVLVSGPLYLALGWVLAKFGYQRKSLKDLRSQAADDDADGTSRRAQRSKKADRSGIDSGSAPESSRRPVAPTSRTAGGGGGSGSRPGGKKKRRR